MPDNVLRCSFCGKVRDEVQHLVAGPGVFICNECVELCERVMSDQPLPSFPPLDGKTDEELLADMARLDASRGQVEAAVQDRVQRLRSRSVTWARIGEALGVSRQSAWERYSGEE
ncbi:ClpX C4-type zinc finger protein [Kribbella sp.]|uniref:ClpX C4-type zinc finger protein n=1 Tax=Kribbella sp. TaxID=1871183 RepID=UPI002D5C3F09|nr:ClpX C4-type zinc finger protein [Kribbella sp.]HZX01718.1 ClpX C4-type zinc finger protein [Kribbella sp.]